ncbi:MAG: replication-associated recombination protein A [Puniceicoccales bacterium]|jgi:putative ATPase|nr:replication-associated recombination protein A [Puniceicoccales bacterium]
MNSYDQADIFGEETVGQRGNKYIPLSVRMRPKHLSDVVGQRNIIGQNCLLPKIIKSASFSSIILYGPPGCGKTTLAEVIANETDSKFVKINAVLSNVAELRDVLLNARKFGRVVLFIDEIHRFNKSQQDLLLYDVENGNISLIGATTHNPGFYVISPLLSRSHLFKLEPLSVEEISSVLAKAVHDADVGLGACKCLVDRSVMDSIAYMANGDLRWALNALETLVLSVPCGSVVGDRELKCFAQERVLRYDANEDDHYDTISAYIKSMRGCDPDAAIYWLAKMINSGEDPRFIARRLVIFASEDVGLADSRALPLATACFEACEKIGMPECQLNLAHTTVFMATAPKSNSTYMALNRATKSIVSHGAQEVPVWLRDAHGAANKKAGNAKDYLYSHEFAKNISGQKYMLTQEKFYFPKQVGSESSIVERMEELEKLRKELNAGKD